jgi:hypothetical protein
VIEVALAVTLAVPGKYVLTTPAGVPAVLVGVVHVFACEKAIPLAELLPRLRSAVVAVTLVLFGYPPLAPGVATTVTVALAPTASAPRAQLIEVVPTQLPTEGVVETQVNPAASVSVRLTPAAAEVPLFLTVIV